MVDDAPKQVAKLILPFAVPAGDQIKAFTKDEEMAAVLYLAESNRKTGDGHFWKKPDEKLAFIAEVCYPIWLVPWNRETLLFDGLGVTTSTLSYNILPDIDAFNHDIQASAKTCETYSKALSRNANYFQNFTGKEEETIEGLITDPDFIRDFWVYLLEVQAAKTPFATKAVVSPTINESDITVFVKELSALRGKIEEDARNLEASMTLLTTATKEKTRAIREESTKNRKKLAQEIKKVKPRVTREIRQIRKKHNAQIGKLSKRFAERLRVLHKNRRKLQNLRKKSPTAKRRIKAIDRKIANVETAKKLKISQQRAVRDTCIEKARKILKGLEASRETWIRTKQHEKTLLEDRTSSIITQMNEMVKLKDAGIHEFYRISMDAYEISRPTRRNSYELIYLPFYLVRYETESKRRYVAYPPSIIGSIGILTKVKGILGGARMESFLQSYSKAITTLLEQLVMLVQKNPVLEREISNAAIQASILRVTELRVGVNRGLKTLKSKKWLSENDRQTLAKLLYTYSI